MKMKRNNAELHWIITIIIVVICSLQTREVTGKAIHSVMGPFRVLPGPIEHCPPEIDAKHPLQYYFSRTRSRYNPDIWFYYGNTTWTFPFDDALSMKATVASWGSIGGWKENAFVIKMDKICSNFRTNLPKFWQELTKDAFNDPYLKCPLPMGVAVYKNITGDFNTKAIPTFFYGKYRITVLCFRTDTRENKVCMRVYADAVPKI
ncbi:ATP-dependent Clp protease ATP-binding subunit ClpX [Frankliniella fusca]|uniref:ATP-dependent Clp protease ATP-binding subunit ClpX n=1 Tax=Frankliniella fusca TaxID=407009 RepID=A0AAE1H0S6_9NEOP|nr:ATP-dependent Clp protease ATP-binding subunit ClpX [Frankliniella fusca]